MFRANFRRMGAVMPGLFLLLSVMLLGNIPAEACCSPTDTSRVKYRYYCPGTVNVYNQDWELAYSNQGVRYVVCTERIYGACTGNYTNCNCTFVSPSSVQGWEHMNIDQSNFTLWWTTYNYNAPTYSNCTSGPCQKTGVVEHLGTYIVNEVCFTPYC